MLKEKTRAQVKCSNTKWGQDILAGISCPPGCKISQPGLLASILWLFTIHHETKYT